MEELTQAVGYSTEQECPYFFRWGFPGSPVRIRLKFDTIPGIWRQIEDGFRHGMEAGGLLLGTRYANHVAIVGFEPFLLEKPRGRFVLTAQDKQRFRQLLDSWNKPDSAVTAVGYFRGSLQQGLSLGEDDLKLIAEFFPEKSGAYLLVTPAADGGAPTADFFFQSEGGVFPESLLPFPFRHPADASMPAAVSSEARTAMRPRVSIGSFAAVVMLCSLLALGLSAGLGSRRAPSRTGHLELSARRTEAELTIHWATTSPFVSAASGGTLFIEQEGRHEKLSLTPGILKTGALVYRPDGPSSESVRVSLEVCATDGRCARETVTLLLPKPPAVRGAAGVAAAPKGARRMNSHPLKS
jgi:hypothetical protein